MASQRTNAQRRAETIARLEDAAIDSLAELGWSSATASDIAKRAGVTRQLIRHYYPDTASLFEAVIRNRSDAMITALDHRLAVHTDEESLPDRLARAVEASWEFGRSREMYAFRELLVATRTDPEVGPAVQEACADVVLKSRTIFLGVIREGDEIPLWFLELGPRLVGAALNGAVVLSESLGNYDDWSDPVLVALIALARASVGEAQDAIGAEVEVSRQWLAARARESAEPSGD